VPAGTAIALPLTVILTSLGASAMIPTKDKLENKLELIELL